MAVEPVTLRDLGPRDVLLKVTAANACVTDAIVLAPDVPPMFGNVAPQIFGHGAVGIIEKVGSHVTVTAPGDRVIASANPLCRTCYYCLRGRPDQCADIVLHGPPNGSLADGQDVVPNGNIGGYAEYAIVPDNQVTPVPHARARRRARTARGRHRGRRRGRVQRGPVQPGSEVAVFGCGATGLRLRAGGPGPAGQAHHRRRPARAPPRDGLTARATDTVDPADGDVVAQIQELTDDVGGFIPRGVDYAFEASANARGMEEAWHATRSAGPHDPREHALEARRHHHAAVGPRRDLRQDAAQLAVGAHEHPARPARASSASSRTATCRSRRSSAATSRSASSTPCSSRSPGTGLRRDHRRHDRPPRRRPRPLPPPTTGRRSSTGATTQPDGFPVLPEWSAEAHLAMMDRVGIETSLLSVSTPGRHVRRRPGGVGARVERERRGDGPRAPGPLRPVREPAGERRRRGARRDRLRARPAGRRRGRAPHPRRRRVPRRPAAGARHGRAAPPPGRRVRPPDVACRLRVHRARLPAPDAGVPARHDPRDREPRPHRHAGPVRRTSVSSCRTRARRCPCWPTGSRGFAALFGVGGRERGRGRRRRDAAAPALRDRRRASRSRATSTRS